MAVWCLDMGEVNILLLRLFEGLWLDRLSDRRLLLGVFDWIMVLVNDVRLVVWSDSFVWVYRLLTFVEGRQVFDFL